MEGQGCCKYPSGQLLGLVASPDVEGRRHVRGGMEGVEATWARDTGLPSHPLLLPSLPSSIFVSSSTSPAIVPSKLCSSALPCCFPPPFAGAHF
eukprot:768658-Hanusia_phi.AAC.2